MLNPRAHCCHCAGRCRCLCEGLRKRGLLSVDPRLPVCMRSSPRTPPVPTSGSASRLKAPKWPMGIPRLHMPRAAPSRSVLKLDEALLTFLSGEKRQQLLRPGMLAIDLGAAPGGWTWLLASMGLRVIAVDNGRIAPAVMQLETVEHRRMDGFKFHPPRGVDWLVCDIIEQPQRVADRLGVWFAKRWCKRAIFNLKLPMKKRYAALLQAQATFEKALSGRRYELQFRQLYHDREEVTGFYQDLQIG
ncbi:MAG: 23S rRNA (cytidine(2498)-2'-O)-methyltransferase RlmM [Gammaproteobacteria bacterium]